MKTQHSQKQSKEISEKKKKFFFVKEIPLAPGAGRGEEKFSHGSSEGAWPADTLISAYRH